MKKIIHFSLTNSKSGITQYILNNWEFIDKTRYQFHMATFGEKLDFQPRLEAEGCKFFYIKNRAENNLNQFRSEIMEIFSMGYDAVHLHTSYWKTFELEMLAKKAGIPRIIIHSHNTAVFDDNGREEKERQHYKLAEMLTADMGTDFWACSQKAAEWLYTDKIPEEKIVIMRNGVDAEKFAYSSAVREEYRSRLNWEDKYVIGHVGRFSYQKNHEFLINVFREIEKINKNARLLLIGKGPLEAEIRLMVQRYDLSEKVRFAGACEDVDGWLQAMDLFCLPSRFEGFPIVAVEAQAAGVPLILGEDVTREVNLCGKAAYVPLQTENWVKEIQLEMSRDLRKRLCQREDRKALIKRHGYDIRDTVKELERLYGDV